VCGGSPLENLFVVVDVERPNITNFANFACAGGTVSILDSELIRNVKPLIGGQQFSLHQPALRRPACGPARLRRRGRCSGGPLNCSFNTKALYDLTPKDRIWAVNFTGPDNMRVGPTNERKTGQRTGHPRYSLRAPRGSIGGVSSGAALSACLA